MNPIAKGALIFGGSVAAGAAIGGGFGAVRSLREEGNDRSFSRMEQRNNIADVIVGAGVGALGGAALLLGRQFVTPLRAIPVVGSAHPAAMIGLGVGVGAASMGAYSLASKLLD